MEERRHSCRQLSWEPNQRSVVGEAETRLRRAGWWGLWAWEALFPEGGLGRFGGRGSELVGGVCGNFFHTKMAAETFCNRRAAWAAMREYGGPKALRLGQS